MANVHPVQEAATGEQARIRDNFKRFQNLPPEQRQKLGRQFQQLTPEQRQQLRERLRKQ